MSRSRPPKYCRHHLKSRPDRAYCRINGKQIVLGVYGSPESKAKYAELLKSHGLDPRPDLTPPADPTVSQIIVAYLVYARRYYQKPDGTDGREFELIRDACKIVHRQFDTLPAREFGPKRLKAVRQEMIDAGLSRNFINKQIDRVRRIFRWAVGEEMIPPSVPQALSMVTGLRKGRIDARETDPVRPVDTEVVDATIAKLPDVVADMVEVQMLTAMGPGELVIMRPCDIDRSDDVWLYTPESHKNKHRGHHRIIALGPQTQAILLRYLARAGNDYLFRPIDSEAKRRAEMAANRRTPLSCGNRHGTNRKAAPKKTPGDRYTVDSYRKAIQRAAKNAGVEKWGPHRLRHTRATEVREKFGLDTQPVWADRAPGVRLRTPRSHWFQLISLRLQIDFVHRETENQQPTRPPALLACR